MRKHCRRYFGLISKKNLTRMCETVDTYHFRKVDGTCIVQFLLLYPR